MTTPGLHAGLRADARRNHQLLIDAARALFVRRGSDVPMEEVARHAGVGVGTLYRRFPNRGSLIQAVAADSFERVLDRAAAAELESTGWDALRTFLEQASDQLRTSALLSAWFPQEWHQTSESTHDQQSRSDLLRFFERVLRRCRSEGSIRTDIGVGDLVFLLTLLLRPSPSGLAGDTDRAQRRALAIALDGLRCDSPEPLPGRRLSWSDLTG